MFRALLFSVLVAVSLTAGANPNPIKDAAAATLPIENLRGDDRYCSSVVVAPGVALTASHCDIGEPASVEQNGKNLPIKSWSHDILGRDLAMVEVPGLQCPCVPLGNAAEDLRPDTPVVVIGFPWGGEQTTSHGVVGTYQLVCYGPDECLMQWSTSAWSRPGSSGGPVFVIVDSKAWLLGILVGGAPTGESFFEEVVR
jgi:S1-C subfamily serine protease